MMKCENGKHEDDDDNNNTTIGRSSNSIPSLISDWDQQILRDEDLQALDAIESAFLSTPSSSSTSTTTASSSSSSIIRKRPSSPAIDNDKETPAARRRRLPKSIVGLCLPFSLSPCRADDVRIKYPVLKFGGQIRYSRTSSEVEKAASDLLQSLEARKRETGQTSVGFDIEWKPNFQKGDLPRKAAVMQICVDASDCHVMHIIHSGITPSLQSLLEDHTIVKVGVGIANDCIKIFKDYNVSVKAVEDLSSLANLSLGEAPRCWGLQSLTEKLVCRELPKPKGIRLGNWEVDVLSQRQLEYAATDAFASWNVCQVLKSLSVSKKEADTGN